MPTPNDSRRLITLDQNGQHVSIDEQTLRVLGGDLTGRQLVTTDDPLHGYDVQLDRRSLLVSPQGYRIPNAGCLPMLRWRATFRGIDLRVRARPAIARLPQPRNVEYLAYQQLARFVHAHDRGLIQRPPGLPVAELVYDLALAYPDQRLVILGNHVRQLNKIRDRLATKIEDVQSVMARRPVIVAEDDPMPQVVCSTFKESCEVDLATSDIVLLLDAYHCVQDRAQLALEQVDARFRLFGIVTKGRTVAPSEADTAMAIFGPYLLEVPGFRKSRREVHVAWIRSHHPNIRLQEDHPDFWSQCYWNNDRRNRSVRQLAEGIVSGRVPQSRKFRQVTEWLGSRGKTRMSVTILVQQMAHAQVLAKLLPGWDIITGDIPLKGCPGFFRNRIKRQRRRWMTGERQIVLADAAKEFRGETSDVVIWAGGGMFAGAVPNSWMSGHQGCNSPLVIVDFRDFHNRTTVDWSRRRERDYWNHNIFQTGISIAQGRAALFLDQQRRWR